MEVGTTLWAVTDHHQIIKLAITDALDTGSSTLKLKTEAVGQVHGSTIIKPGTHAMSHWDAYFSELRVSEGRILKPNVFTDLGEAKDYAIKWLNAELANAERHVSHLRSHLVSLNEEVSWLAAQEDKK
jgi:hypothetical protein